MSRTSRSPQPAGKPKPATVTGQLDVAIIGAGAAGLMAAVTAAEAGLACLLIDRKHKPGRKLLMCGNARCNLTNNRPAADFLEQLDAPTDAFAASAIEAFPPARLREWLDRHGLRTIIRRGQRVFPASERASDVVHMFADALRDAGVPQLSHSPVVELRRHADGIEIQLETFTIQAKRVLLCTGGVSYPKTGSVGDGQRFAKSLGHTVTPYRPGLAGMEVAEDWVKRFDGVKLEDCLGRLHWRGGEVTTVEGDFECARWGIGGGLVSNATRLVARSTHPLDYLELELMPASAKIGNGHSAARQYLASHHPQVPPAFWKELAASAPDALHHWRLTPQRIRPLKEAMVTVGGVSLDEVDPTTMQSTVCPPLYFAGEVMDIDGPTGGYNLQLAFATAQQAVHAIAKETGCRPPAAAQTRRPPKADRRPRQARSDAPWQRDRQSRRSRRR